MFSSFIPRGVPSFGFGKMASKGSAIDIPPVEVLDIETILDKRSRKLKHLLRLNHITFSILFNNLRFHNHTPHHLVSAYLLNSPADHLEAIYDDAAAHEGHEHWVDSPSEIALHDYRDFLGKREYQRAWVDFFEDQLVLHGYDWKEVVTKFLFETGSKSSHNPLPMFNTLTAGLAHPLIHLGYAYEIDSREVAMEALGLVATCYDPHLASILDQNTKTNTTSTANPMAYSTSNPLEVFARVCADTRLNDAFKDKEPGSSNISLLLNTPHLLAILLQHFNAWKITDPKTQFEQSQQLATALLISSASSVGGNGYDFFLVHLLTSSHAVRILIPNLDATYHLPLVREWWLIALVIYIAQLRPVVKLDYVRNVELQDRNWGWAEKLAIEGKHSLDVHFVKAVRAMKEAGKIWGDDDEFYLKAAVKFVDEFERWQFGAEGEEMEEVERK